MPNAYNSKADNKSTNVVPFPKKEPPVLSPKTPMVSARELVARAYSEIDFYDGAGMLQTLHHSGGDFLEWRRTRYERVNDDAMRAAVWRFLENAKRREAKTVKGKDGEETTKFVAGPFHPVPSNVSAVLDALKAVTHLDTVELPTWLDDSGRPPASELLACSNGLLHIPTRQLLEHTPAFIGVNAVPYAYDRDAPEPSEWLRFLRSLWGDDPESITTLQEWFGYCLTHDTSLHKMLFIVGPLRSGKGTIGRVITAMLGAANVAGPKMHALGGPFALQPLLDKQLAIVPDARLTGRADQGAICENLLSISGQDLVAVDRKHKDALHMRMPIKFMLLSNEAPAINDASGALPRRFIVLQCTQSFFDKEDHGLEDKLLAELPGILLWSLEGLARLRARGHGFVQPASAAEMIQHMQDLGSPVSVFLRECCELGPDKTADAGQLYDAWYHWCRDGGQKPSNRAVFGRDLAATVTGLRIGRAWSSEGPRARRYVGVGLLPSAEKGAESPDGFEVIDLSDLGL